VSAMSVRIVFHFSDPTKKKLDFADEIKLAAIDEDIYDFLVGVSEVIASTNYNVTQIEVIDEDENDEEEEEDEGE